jgi:hypothetical protein
VFNRQPGGLIGFEAFRVSILFANSFAATFLSLIPFGFFTSDGLRKQFGELPATLVLRSKSLSWQRTFHGRSDF